MGLWFDEIQAGQRIALGSYLFTRENILAFARKYDPQPFHIDDEAARASHYGGLIASGWHTASAWMSCWVDANKTARAVLAAWDRRLPEDGPSPGFTDLRWLKPVRVGDTLHYSAEVTGTRELASRPGWGLAMCHNAGVNQNGETAFSFEGKVFVARR